MSFLVLAWLALALSSAGRRIDRRAAVGLFCSARHGNSLEWWRSQRSAKRLLNTFSHYVAKPVLNELLRAGATVFGADLA